MKNQQSRNKPTYPVRINYYRTINRLNIYYFSIWQVRSFYSIHLVLSVFSCLKGPGGDSIELRRTIEERWHLG